MWVYIFSGLMIGFAGSFHCVGMCGPLALAMPSKNTGNINIIISSIQYNIGRSITYAFLGFMFGWLGNGFFIAGYQQWISITGGILILFFWLLNYTNYLKMSWLKSFTHNLQLRLNKLINGPFSKHSSGLIGLLNGLLPCGLVYVAIGASLTTGNPVSGSLLMFSFGMGTLPLMFILMVFGKRIRLFQKIRLTRLVPAFVLCVSLILILRGLNLGIPFISPSINVEGSTPKMIHCGG